MDNNEAVNNGSSLMAPLEIEEEMLSLFEETAGSMNVVSKLRFRKKSSKQAEVDGGSTGFRGLLRTKTAYILRNVAILACLCLLVALATQFMRSTVEHLSEEDQLEKDPRGPHQSSFGGSQNLATLEGEKAHNTHSETDIHDSVELPMDNIGQKVPSISWENENNHIGHYWHDPHRSPWSSHLYDRNQTQLDQEQSDFLNKQNETKAKYGSWDLVDPYFAKNGKNRPLFSFAPYKNSDAPTERFVEFNWQNDKEYVGMLIDEAKKLIDRVKEGIYEQYGHPKNVSGGFTPSNVTLNERSKLFGVITQDYDVNADGEAVDLKSKEKLQGVAYLNENGWEALQRKLLHAMITKGDFYVVLVGDANAAGHGNNFLQSSIMSFHYLMEPVLDFLGIHLVCRNMAMKDTPTILSALAGSDIYGEADILLYSSKSAESAGSLDLLYKQSVMSGETVPIILTSWPGNFMNESNGTAWLGNLQPGREVCGTQSQGPCNFDAFNSVCWVDRIDVNITTPQEQEISAETYDGYRVHQLEGNKLALLVLNAIDAALNNWVRGIESDGFPLNSKHWHVENVYDGIRESVRTLKGGEQELSECEKMMGDLRIICRIEMHGFSEFTPRIVPYRTSLEEILHFDMDLSYNYKSQTYDGFDLLPLSWKVPSDQVDVHAIAIATSAPPPKEHDYSTADDDLGWPSDDDDLDNDMMRILYDEKIRWRRASEAATNTFASTKVGVVPGKGWAFLNRVSGFCDGSAQSTCGRGPENSCLLAGHNSHHSGIIGNGLSGWLVMNVKNVKEGIVLVRLDVDVDPNSENEGRNRELLPQDFQFDFAINGNVTTWSSTEFKEAGFEVTEGVTIYSLMMDKEKYLREKNDGDDGTTVEVAIRMRSALAVTMALTHLFYA
jgi:hypothetical protein